ncbi:MAG: phosphopantothenate/pantothenate synthetase [Thermoplasmata archaeon]
MRLSPRHPRYHSLVVRADLAAAARSGLVVPEGLIAHGRGEAFDYLLGERTSRSARAATRVAAQWLRAARHPVLSVNGNVAALASRDVARLQRALPALGVEVNLFHRTPPRVALVRRSLERAGIRHLLGLRPTARIPGLPSDRARVDRRGIYTADVCLVPLEDGDRTRALRALGKRVISIDLNPLSRTSRDADLPIIDEVSRALRNLASDVRRIPRSRATPGQFAMFDSPSALDAARVTIAQELRRAARAR